MLETLLNYLTGLTPIFIVVIAALIVFLDKLLKKENKPKKVILFLFLVLLCGFQIFAIINNQQVEKNKELEQKGRENIYMVEYYKYSNVLMKISNSVDLVYIKKVIRESYGSNDILQPPYHRVVITDSISNAAIVKK